jgi:hypothetical protein
MICLAAAAGIARARSFFADRQRIGLLMPVAVISLSVLLFWPTVKAVEQRANGTKTQIQQVVAMASATPPDSVFLSYVYNDLLIYYGQRSVLNYRRIPPADVQTGRYTMEILEPCLVAVVGKLLEAGHPVYYVEDKAPPFWDSLALLQRHFVLEPAQQDPKVYQVLAGDNQSGWGELARCGR